MLIFGRNLRFSYSVQYFCSFFQCLVIFFVFFCLFRRSYKDQVFPSLVWEKVTPPQKLKLSSSLRELSVTCSKVLMDDLTTSLLLICESEIQSIDTFLFYETNAKQQPLLALLHARVTSVFSFHFFVQCTVAQQ